MTAAVVILAALVALCVVVKILDSPRWGVETYTLSVSEDLPNVATPLGALPSPAEDRGQATEVAAW